MGRPKKAEPFDQGRYIQQFMKEHSKVIRLYLSRENDSDVIEQLENVPNASGYIKALIRADIAKEKQR